MISTFIFIISSFIVTENEVEIDSVGTTVTQLATYRIPDTEKEFVPIFISDGRIYSLIQILIEISNLAGCNWRHARKNIFLKGYGFNEKIPAMNDPLRAGDDGLNENIHNFL